MEPIRVLSIMEAAFVTGPAKNLIEFARMSRPRVDLRTATYQRGDVAEAESNPYVQAARKAGMEVSIIGEQGRFDSSAITNIAKILEHHRPHIVQTHNVKSHFLMRYSGLYRKYRWLAFHHGYTSTDLKMRMYNQLDRWSLPAAVHVMTVCGAFHDQLTAHGIPSPRITVQHNAIRPFTPAAPEVLAQLRSRYGIGAPVLVQVGRLSHEKGHLDLLEALARLKALPWHLLVLGEGPERGPIEAAISRLGLSERVTLTGLQADVQPFLSLADVFLMPSHSEGSPNAMLEAMSAGLPVVASAVGGIPELATNEQTALLGPARDAAHLAARIERCLKQPAAASEMGERARQSVAIHTYENYTSRLVAVYDRVLKASPGDRL